MKIKKRLIECYGFFRLILGSAQLVALSAGYFLNEVALGVPVKSKFHIFDQETLGLIFLPLFFRAIFHIVAGSGIALLKDWGRQRVLVGWPIMVLITLGLTHVIANQWLESGLIDSTSQAISWLGVLLYLGIIVLDYTVVGNFIQRFEDEKNLSKELGPSLQGKHVFIVFFIAVLSFIIILYLGRPMKQGFHKGFYRASGKKEVVTDQVKTLQASAPKTKAVEVPSAVKAPVEEPKVEAIYREKEALPAAVVSEKQAEDPLSAGVLWKKEQGKQEEGMSNAPTIAWIGAFMIIIGFGLLVKDFLGNGKEISLSAFVLFGVGFALWTAFGVMKHLLPITFASLLSVVANLIIIMAKLKDND